MREEICKTGRIWKSFEAERGWWLITKLDEKLNGVGIFKRNGKSRNVWQIFVLLFRRYFNEDNIPPHLSIGTYLEKNVYL